MKPRSLPTTFASEAEYKRRLAETVNGLLALLEQNGVTADRPGDPRTGQMFYDTTIGKPIWWNGSAWRDAAGAAV